MWAVFRKILKLFKRVVRVLFQAIPAFKTIAMQGNWLLLKRQSKPLRLLERSLSSKAFDLHSHLYLFQNTSFSNKNA
jgi:hypothetical protein